MSAKSALSYRLVYAYVIYPSNTLANNVQQQALEHFEYMCASNELIARIIHILDTHTYVRPRLK